MPRKKIQPLFEEPQKKEKPLKKEVTSKTATPKKEPIKKELPKKEIKKPEVAKKEIKPKTTKAPTKKVEVKRTEVKSPAKPLPKKSVAKKEVIPKPKSLPKVKEIKIEDTEEITNVPEETPIISKSSKRKSKIDKNAPPKKIKHKLKVGDSVLVTFLGTPRKGVIIELSQEGMYKVKTDQGLTLPRAKHIEGDIPDKYYPSYIIKVL
jgi:hypothetical protein